MQRDRPGIAKAPALPESPAEADADVQGPAVRAILDDLDVLIGRTAEPALAGFCWGDPRRGGARLVSRRGSGEHESLQISWNHKEIERIEIEPQPSSSFQGPEQPVDAALLVERLVPMMWAHIQRGGELPVGIDRFARLF